MEGHFLSSDFLGNNMKQNSVLILYWRISPREARVRGRGNTSEMRKEKEVMLSFVYLLTGHTFKRDLTSCLVMWDIFRKKFWNYHILETLKGKHLSFGFFFQLLFPIGKKIATWDIKYSMMFLPCKGKQILIPWEEKISLSWYLHCKCQTTNYILL